MAAEEGIRISSIGVVNEMIWEIIKNRTNKDPQSDRISERVAFLIFPILR